MTIHFDTATRNVIELATRLDAQGLTVVVVRDIVGRLSIVVDDSRRQVSPEEVDTWRGSLEASAQHFAAKAPIVLANDLFYPDEIFNDLDLQPLDLTRSGPRTSGFIDRQIVGTEWSRVGQDPSHQRVTLYGYKGGVGRSTASFMLAKHLADDGHNVLVVDLDLESPGVGPLLQSGNEGPEYGLVDYLIESALGPVSDLDLIARSDRIAPVGNGEIWVAPARGRSRENYTYLPKLNRVYADAPAWSSSQVLRFADRLDNAVSACEREVERRSRALDVVLLDSRAGVHDIAAVAITQLSDLSLLFATDNQQTWTGYSELFEQWRSSGKAPMIRERLRMVASMTPTRGSDHYLEKFRDRAQACFAAYLYDDVESGDETAYNPSPDDADAPHSPLPILFSTDLLGLDQDESPDWHESEFVRAAYARFLAGATELVTGEQDV